MTDSRVYMSMVFAAFCWAGAFIAGKIALAQFPPVSLTFFRFIIAMPVFLLFLYFREPQHLLPTKIQWKPLIILGIGGPFLYHVLFFVSLKLTTAVNSALITTLLPVMTTLLAVLFFKEKITLIQSAGILIALIGVVLTVSGGDLSIFTNLSFNAGDVIMLAAVCIWSVYWAANSRVMKRYAVSPLLLTTYTFGVGTVACIPFAFLERPLSFLGQTTAAGWLAIVYMALFPTALAPLIQNIAIHRIGAPKATIFNNLTPVITIFLSILILGEPFSLFKLFCAAVIISGVLLVTRPGRGEEAAAQTEEKSVTV